MGDPLTAASPNAPMALAAPGPVVVMATPWFNTQFTSKDGEKWINHPVTGIHHRTSKGKQQQVQFEFCSRN